MPSINLSDIQEAAEKKYGPYVVKGVPGGDVTLVTLLRLPKDKRKQFVQLAKSLEGFDLDSFEDDIAPQFEEALRLAAKNKAEGDRLIKALGGDLAMLLEVFTGYSEASQPGEASPSQS